MKQLKGSEKQIAWAEKIRNGAMETCEINIKLAKEKIERYPGVADFEYDLKAFENLKNQFESLFDDLEDASKIIDKRDVLSSNHVIYMAGKIREEMKRKEK